MGIAINRKFVEWINKYKYSFIVTVLILGNGAQYIEGIRERSQLLQTIDKIQSSLNTANKESVDYERLREQTQDELLRELLRHK